MGKSGERDTNRKKLSQLEEELVNVREKLLNPQSPRKTNKERYIESRDKFKFSKIKPGTSRAAQTVSGTAAEEAPVDSRENIRKELEQLTKANENRFKVVRAYANVVAQRALIYQELQKGENKSKDQFKKLDVLDEARKELIKMENQANEIDKLTEILEKIKEVIPSVKKEERAVPIAVIVKDIDIIKDSYVPIEVRFDACKAVVNNLVEVQNRTTMKEGLVNFFKSLWKIILSTINQIGDKFKARVEALPLDFKVEKTNKIESESDTHRLLNQISKVCSDFVAKIQFNIFKSKSSTQNKAVQPTEEIELVDMNKKTLDVNYKP